jgi:hypothetical protein
MLKVETAMVTAPPRRSLGFSLDEAASIRKMIVGQAARMACPTCGAELRHTVGGDGTRRVWLVRCVECGRGVVDRSNG